LKLLIRLLACLPLAVNHALGVVVGRLVFLASPKYRRCLLDNASRSGVVPASTLDRFARRNTEENGKGLIELAWALGRPDQVPSRVVARDGWDCVERLRASGRPIIFVTPHLGAYDVAGRYLWGQLPIVAMYRPHRIRWVDALLREGRNQGAAPHGTNVAPANVAGVRLVLKHLRRGGCTVLLPDQVPRGEGEWVDFFGRPAYTMTLPARLQQASGAALVFCYARRLPRGRGYELYLRELEEPLSSSRREAAAQVNRMIERLIRACPEQYLWCYNRYKRPPKAPPPPATRGAA
jgi:KDO2-lipid IV(A) lauroyltransferase